MKIKNMCLFDILNWIILDTHKENSTNFLLMVQGIG